jgi:hypothetical protein
MSARPLLAAMADIAFGDAFATELSRWVHSE